MLGDYETCQFRFMAGFKIRKLETSTQDEPYLQNCSVIQHDVPTSELEVDRYACDHSIYHSCLSLTNLKSCGSSNPKKTQLIHLHPLQLSGSHKSGSSPPRAVFSLSWIPNEAEDEVGFDYGSVINLERAGVRSIQDWADVSQF